MRYALWLGIGFVVGAVAVLGYRTRHHEPLPAVAPPTMPERSAPAAAGQSTVNSVCALCGMPVDPTIPTATYRGRAIGFGCRACPSRFAAEPDRYGPAALRNEVVE